MSSTRRAQLRWVQSEEAQKARSFWDLHPTRFLTPRSTEVLRDSAIFVLELDGHWAACTAIFPLADLPVAELSDTRVVEGLNGFGLQRDVLTPIRLAYSFLYEFMSEIVMVIDRENKKSMSNCREAGFVDWVSPRVDVVSELDLANEQGQYTLLHLPKPTVVQQIARFLERLSKTNGVTLRRGDEQLDVSINCKLIQDAEIRHALERVVTGAQPIE